MVCVQCFEDSHCTTGTSTKCNDKTCIAPTKPQQSIIAKPGKSKPAKKKIGEKPSKTRPGNARPGEAKPSVLGFERPPLRSGEYPYPCSWAKASL